MKIETILKKVAKGEELTDAEKKTLQEYKEPKHDDSKEKEPNRTQSGSVPFGVLPFGVCLPFGVSSVRGLSTY